jgi:hypothetical protein
MPRPRQCPSKLGQPSSLNLKLLYLLAGPSGLQKAGLRTSLGFASLATEAAQE